MGNAKSGCTEREQIKVQKGVDREQLEEVAENLSQLANKLNKQSAIDNELPKALHNLEGKIYDSLPHSVEVNRTLTTDSEQ